MVTCSRFSRKGDAFAVYFGRIKHFQVVSWIKPCFDTTSDDDRVIEVLTFSVEKIRNCSEIVYCQVKFIIIVFQFFQFNQKLTIKSHILLIRLDKKSLKLKKCNAHDKILLSVKVY